MPGSTVGQQYKTSGATAAHPAPTIGAAKPADAPALNWNPINDAQVVAGGAGATADAAKSVASFGVEFAKIALDPLRAVFVILGFVLIVIGVSKLFGSGVSLPAGDQQDQSPEEIEVKEEAPTRSNSSPTSRAIGGSTRKPTGVAGTAEEAAAA